MTTAKNPARKRYIARFIPTMAVYVAAIFTVSWVFNRYEPTGPIAWGLALLPALPLLAIIAIMGVYLSEEGDEFIRKILVESMLWGVGLTLAIMTVWGFLEIYAGRRSCRPSGPSRSSASAWAWPSPSSSAATGRGAR